MINSKQLYQNNTFYLPEIGSVTLDPFPNRHSQLQPDLQRNVSLRSIFQSNEPPIPLHCNSYSNVFEQICARENLYPFMLDSGKGKIAVVCRQCVLLLDWKVNQLGRILEGGDDILILEKANRIKLNEVPTSIRVGRCNMFVGYQSGRIAQYSFKTSSWEGVSDELQFPVMQIEIVSEEQNKQASILALDSAGNMTFIVYSHKTFMEKIIKTLTTARWISFVFRNKKREKIKKLFKSLISKEKENADTQASSSDTVDSLPYHYNRFHVKQIADEIAVSLFRNNSLELLILSRNYQVKRSIVVDDSFKSQKDVEVSFVELGEGGFQNSNNTHNIIVLGINRTIYFFRLIPIEESYEVVKVSEVTVEDKILSGRFVSNNLFWVGDNTGLHLANINDKPSPLLLTNMDKFSYINFFIEEDGLDMDRKLTFNHLATVLGEGRKHDKIFACLQGKRMIIGSVFSWLSIMERLVYLDKNWECAMKFYENVYNGSFRRCCKISENISVRRAQMRQLCSKISAGYLDKHLSHLAADVDPPQSALKQRRHTINNIIYFLLKCDEAELLFTEVAAFVEKHQLMDLFLSELSHYVEQTNGYNLKIPFMSEKIMNLVIRKYKDEGQEYVLQKLFRQFDLTQMEKLVLLTICLREGLYQSLIYICCEQKDYITPIIKLCGMRLTNLEKQGRIAEVIYWYLSECLLGRMTDYGNESDYINMLAILINFIFIPSSLEMLLQTSHIYLMQIINMFFETRILRFVLENEDKFFMRKGEEGDPIFEESSLREYLLYEKMISTLIRVVQNVNSQQKDRYELEMNRLLTSIMLKNQFPFLVRLKIKIILFYINHPHIFIGDIEDLSEQKQIEMNGHLMRLLDSMIRSINEKCLYLRQQIKEDAKAMTDLEVLLTKEKEKELNGFLEAVMLSPYNRQFAQTKCYIHHELGHYSEVFQIYLRMTNRMTRMKLYLYLENNLNEYPQLTQQFLKYMISLLNMDEKKTVRLIWQLREGWADHEEIIDKLVEFPTIQLAYIEKVIEGAGQKSKKLLLRHLQIVLREKGDCVQSYINRIDYPLQQAFRMCEERNNRMGKACILIKSGRNMEGVVIITEIFLQSIQEYLRGLFKKISYDVERKDRIMKQFRVVLETCSKEWTIDNDRGEQIWEKNAEIIFKKLNINNIDSPHIPQTIRDILNEIVTELLSTMLEQVSTDFFLNRFIKTFSSLPVRIFVQAYKYIYQRLEFTFVLERLNKDLLQSQQIQTWKDIMQTIYHGHICNLICNGCSHAITINERMVSYDCSHIFHEECYYEQNNKKNKNQLCPICFNNIDSYMICGDNKIERYRLEVNENELHKFKISKMNYYDRTSLRSAMENWSKFEEWVDL